MRSYLFRVDHGSFILVDLSALCSTNFAFLSKFTKPFNWRHLHHIAIGIVLSLINMGLGEYSDNLGLV